jgi:hypothetical protein
MGKLDLERVRKAWGNAAPGDIVRALNQLEDYDPSVRAIVREEAERRGLTVSSVEAFPAPPFESLRGIAAPAERALQRRGVRSLVRLVGTSLSENRRPFILAAILGLFYVFSATALGAFAMLLLQLLFLGLYILGLGLICLPRRGYLVPVLAPLLAGSVGVAAITAHLLAYWAPGPPSILNAVAIGAAAQFAITAIAPAALFATVVYLRNRWWPEPRPGHCRVCDYDLRGLPEPRCPECGTPFDPAEGAAQLNDDARLRP